MGTQLREQIAEWRRQRVARAQWANARTFGELGELTARFIEGTLRYHPNGHSDGPDEETNEIGPTLAAVNRAGCVTIGSQPGCDGDWWRQRAAVEMLVDDPDVRARLRVERERVGLIYRETKPRRWRRDYETTEIVSEHRIDGEWSPATGFGSTDTRGHISRELACSEAAEYACRNAWQVTVIDPEWGSNDRFVSALDEFSGRQGAENDERAAVERTRDWKGDPLTEEGKRFYRLREVEGYKGPIDQNGNKAPCLVCDQPDCTGRQGFKGKCNGVKTKDGRATSTAVQNGGTSRTTAGGTMSVDLDVPTATATDASTHETLAQALRETADNARRSAVDKDAQAESLRSQASALQDKPDMADSAQALLNEAARLAEVAEARRGMASAYEDKAAQVDAQRAK